LQKFATKEKTPNNVGGEGGSKYFNTISATNYVSFTSTKVYIYVAICCVIYLFIVWLMLLNNYDLEKKMAILIT
jgi:hypothetical protein